MSKTPFIFIRGVYQNSHTESFKECLVNLRGKTTTAIVYFRNPRHGIELLPDLVNVAKANGINLEGGFEIAGALVMPHESYPITWDKLWNPFRWAEIANWCKQISNITNSRRVTLIHEPATNLFFEGAHCDWKKMHECYRIVYKQGIQPFCDLPMIWPKPAEKVRCKRYIQTVAKAFSPISTMNWMSKAQWMTAYEFDPATDEQMRHEHKQIVGAGRFFPRIFSCINKQHHFESDMAETHSIIDNNDGNPIIVYPRFDDKENGVEVAREL